MSDLSDYVNAVLLKGQKADGTLANIKIDDLGRLFAVLKALYGTEYKDLQCDADGILKLNIAAQALGYTTSRSTCGGGQLGWGGTTVAPNATTNLVYISGKGIVYGGIVFANPATSLANDGITMFVDGGTIFSARWGTFNGYNITRYGDCVAWLSMYDDVLHKYLLNVRYGITFETSLLIQYNELTGNTPTIDYNLVYGLMP